MPIIGKPQNFVPHWQAAILGKGIFQHGRIHNGNNKSMAENNKLSSTCPHSHLGTWAYG